MPVKVNTDKCTGCKECVASCPFEAIEIKDEKAFINEYCQFCMACITVCPEGAILETETDKAKPEKAEGHKGVWIFAEQRNGRVGPVAYELLGVGRKLALDLNTELSAILFGATDAMHKSLSNGARTKFITLKTGSSRILMMNHTQKC